MINISGTMIKYKVNCNAADRALVVKLLVYTFIRAFQLTLQNQPKYRENGRRILNERRFRIWTEKN